MAFLVYPANNAFAQSGIVKVQAQDFAHVKYADDNGYVQTMGFEFYKNKKSRKVVAYFSVDALAGFVRVDD